MGIDAVISAQIIST